MKTLDKKVCCEMGDIARRIRATEKQTGLGESDFINFLQYCAERINKGDSVQAIWSDFQKTVQ